MKTRVPLVLYLEIETSDASPEGVDAAIADIDGQISGQLREIRTRTGDGWVYADYQVVHTHGAERTDAP